VLREVRSQVAPEDVGCADLRAEVDAWQSGDLPESRCLALERHAAHCAPCAHQVRVSFGVAALLRNWRTPVAPPGLKERILDEWVRAERQDSLRRSAEVDRKPVRAAAPPPTRVRRRPKRRRWINVARSTALAAAAALLIVAYVGLQDNGDGWRRDHDRAPAVEQPIQPFVQKVQLQAVAYEQYPAGIGAFDTRQPMVADRTRRKSGNLFHQTLRKTLASTAMIEAKR
jgi:hypothetical protein